MPRLPPPVPPPVRHIARAERIELDDAESLASTLERKPVRNATARFGFASVHAAIGAAVAIACVIAGITGVLVGRARASRAPAAVVVPTARTARIAVVVEANEEITQLPILAPGKVSESPLAEAVAAPPRPVRRSGFGHMGADRVASGAAARRPAPHRR